MTTGPPTAPDVWSSRDYPVLVAAVQLSDAEAFAHPSATAIMEATGLDLQQVLAGLRALQQAGLIDVTFSMGGGRNSHVDAISGQARQITGAWPTADVVADRILETAEAMLEADISEIERSKWQAIRDGAITAGRDVLVQLAAAAMTGHLPH